MRTGIGVGAMVGTGLVFTLLLLSVYQTRVAEQHAAFASSRIQGLNARIDANNAELRGLQSTIRELLQSRAVADPATAAATDPSEADLERLLKPGRDWLSQHGHLPKRAPLELLKRDPTACSRTIAFGGEGDGAWPTCVDKLEPQKCLVYAFGVGEDSRFDVAIANYGCEVHSFDPTPSVVEMMAKRHPTVPNHKFHPWGLSATTGTESLNNWWTKYKEYQVQMYTLEDIVKQLGHVDRKVDVLKLDIEGFEFPVWSQVLAANVSQVLFELHMNEGRNWVGAFDGLWRKGLQPFWVSDGRYHCKSGPCDYSECVRTGCPGALQEFSWTIPTRG